MTNTRLHRFVGHLALLICLGTGLKAQTILVTSGEHPGFTRVVLQSTQSIDWRLDDGAEPRRVALELGARRVDLSRAYRRIGQTRLLGMAMAGDRLVLSLACDCPVRAWTERTGLVVLDIRDPAPSVAEEADRPTPALAGTDRHGQAAGLAFARFWQMREEDREVLAPTRPDPGRNPSDADESPPDRAGLILSLTQQLAGAMGQGVLAAAGVAEPAHGTTLPADAVADVMPGLQLRISSVTDRPDLASLALDEPPTDNCAEAQSLAFLVDGSGPGFSSGLADTMRDWIGEFDRTDPSATLTLARHYLRHGFGAETRALLEQSTDPIDGQTLLMGLGDLLEGRPSNARRLVAGYLHCGGPAAMLAALADAPPPLIAARATEIALTFARFPAGLRSILGADLVRVLIDAGAIDVARVIAETLRRGVQPGHHDLALIDAMLDRARGDLQRAAARLDAQTTPDQARLRMRLALARETGEVLPATLLNEAEALAATQRSTTTGHDLMADVIDLYLIRGEGEIALALLDRLTTWPTSGSDVGRQRQLRDAIWGELARRADDPALIVLALTRDDWRDPALSTTTRETLDNRLARFDLGPGYRPAGENAPPSFVPDAETRQSATEPDGDEIVAQPQPSLTEDPRSTPASEALSPLVAALWDMIDADLLTGASPESGSLSTIAATGTEIGDPAIPATDAVPARLAVNETTVVSAEAGRMPEAPLPPATPMTRTTAPVAGDQTSLVPELLAATDRQPGGTPVTTNEPDPTREPGMLRRASLLLDESQRLRLSLTQTTAP